MDAITLKVTKKINGLTNKTGRLRFLDRNTQLPFYKVSNIITSSKLPLTHFCSYDLETDFEARAIDEEMDINDVPFEFGDLIIAVSQYPMELAIELNNLGELEIIGKDADKYEINSKGELEYTL